MHARCRIAAALFSFLPALGADEPAQSKGSFHSLDELNASYQRQSQELDRRQLADLAALGERSKGADADAAYSQLFHLAIRRGLGTSATAAADRCLASPSSPRELRALATLVRINAANDKGDDEKALTELKAFLKTYGNAETAAEAEAALAVGEAFLQRQIGTGRYEAARSICEFACALQSAPEVLKDHFESRMQRIGLLGKSAPAISGVDVDGHKHSLRELKGKVVLVDFWATWCPPCVAAMPRLNALAEKHRGHDFEILGVNVDAMHEDVKNVKTALVPVRRFLVEHRVHWSNVLNGSPTSAPSRQLRRLEEIPATFLIGRDCRQRDRVRPDGRRANSKQAITKALTAKPAGK